MEGWWKDVKRVLWGVAIVAGLLFVVFVINQFVLLFNFLSVLHPWLAIAVTVALGVALVWIIWSVARQLFSAPQVLELEPDASEEEREAYLDSLVAMLRLNPRLAKIDFDNPDWDKEELVQTCFTALEEQSLPLIKENANAIFLTTAVSQNGSLDSLVVLFSLMRMIWQLARIYQTRPSLVSMAKLYGQVAGVVLMARTLEDADLIEYQMEPLITSILGESIASAIPGMVPIANLIVSSLMEGAVNSFLTLRVGIVTQNYLTNYEPVNKQVVRRSASMRSMGYMGEIISTNSKTIVKTVGNAVKKAGVGTAKKWFNFGER